LTSAAPLPGAASLPGGWSQCAGKQPGPPEHYFNVEAESELSRAFWQEYSQFLEQNGMKLFAVSFQ
jgi:hypothetical protein